MKLHVRDIIPVLLKDYQVTELIKAGSCRIPTLYIPESENTIYCLISATLWGESGAVRDAYIKQVDGNTIEGYVITEPEYVKKSIRRVFGCHVFYKLDRAYGICRHEVFIKIVRLMAVMK